MRFVRTYKVKFTLVVALFIALISLSITLLAVARIKAVAVESFSSQGIELVRRLSREIDGERFQRLARTMSEQDPYYDELYQTLYAAKQQSNCSFLYTMVPTGGNNFTYVVDGSTTPDDEENFSPLGTEEDLTSYGKYPHQVLSERSIVCSKIEKQEGWGYAITVYAPIILSGSAIGFLACDFAADEIMSIIASARFIMILVSGVLAIVCLAILYGWISLFFSRLKSVSSRMSEIAGGASDLTARIPTSGNNELSDISISCNSIIQKLQEMISTQKQAVTRLSENSRKLLTQNKESSNLIDTAGGSIGEICGKAQNQKDMTGEAADTIEFIVGVATSLDQKAHEQKSAVETSFQAVEQIAENIEETNETISKVSSEYAGIVSRSHDGREKQTQVTEKITVIEELTKKLSEANRVISEISSQTNLLAMNAAIEAAHAGEAGRGFSVVANEIRTLATNSDTQTKSIKELIENIENAVKEMVEASTKSSLSFNALEQGIRSMDSSLKNVSAKINAQAEESKKIQQMIDVIASSSESISDSSGQLKGKNSLLEEQIKELRMRASEILTSSHDATENLDKIKNFARDTASQSEENLSLSESVKNIVDSYKTE